MSNQKNKTAAKPKAENPAAATTKPGGTGAADANLTGAAAEAGATDTPNAGATGSDVANTQLDGAGTADANLTGAAAEAGAAGIPNAGAISEGKPGTKKQKVKALQVVAKVESFRRGGRVFNRTVSTVRLVELTDEQIKQIKDEPLLTVTEVEVDAE